MLVQPASTPYPPAAVIAIAKAAAQSSGCILSRDPESCFVSKEDRSGHTLWRLDWYNENPSVDITVDEQAGIAVAYENETASKQTRAEFKAGQTTTLSWQQATAVVDNLTANLSLAATVDWQYVLSEQSSFPGDNGKPGRPYWFLIKNRVINGQPIPLDSFFVWMDPYTGQVESWEYQDGAVLMYPRWGFINVEVARRTADAGFRQYMGLCFRPGDPTTSSTPNSAIQPIWDWVSRNTFLCRQYYNFAYDLPAAPDPNYNEQTSTPDTPYYGHGRALIFARIDAETGEIVGVASASGGFGGGQKVTISPRVQLANALLAEHALGSLSMAILSGLPAPARTPSSSARQFSQTVGKQTIHFAFNAAASRLTWQTTDGAWAGVALPQKQVAAVNAWLKTLAQK